MMAYEDEEYDNQISLDKNNRRGIRLHLIDLETKKEYDFPSYASTERFFGFNKKTLEKKVKLQGKDFIYLDRYQIKVLN